LTSGKRQTLLEKSIGEKYCYILLKKVLAISKSILGQKCIADTSADTEKVLPIVLAILLYCRY
jgi:hypothetical protein